MLFIVSLLFSLLSSISSYQSPLHYQLSTSNPTLNIQTGTQQTNIDQFILPNIKPYFTIQFNKPFLYSPKIIANIRGIFSCPSAHKQFFITGASTSLPPSLTNVTIEGYMHLGAGYDSTFHIKIYYFASEVMNGYILIGSVNWIGSSNNNMTYSIPFSWYAGTRQLFEKPQTYVGCFANGIYCRQPTSSKFYYSNICSKDGDHTILVTMESVTNLPIECAGYSNMISYIIIFDQSATKCTLESGVLIGTPGSSGALSIDPYEASTVFIIGLVSLQTTDGCLRFELEPSNTEVNLNYNLFTELQFNYVKINYFSTHPPLKLAILHHNPFVDQVVYSFQNLNFYQYFPQALNTYNSTYRVSRSSPNGIYNYLASKIPDVPIHSKFQLLGNIVNIQVSVSILVIHTKYMRVDPLNHMMTIYIFNTNSTAVMNNFTSVVWGYSLKEVINVNQTVTAVRYEYLNNTIIGGNFYFYYLSVHHVYNRTLLYLLLITVTEVKIDIQSHQCHLRIEGIHNSTTLLLSQFKFNNNNISNIAIVKQQDFAIQFQYYHKLSDWNNTSIGVVYTTSSVSQFQIYFDLKPFTIYSIEIDYAVSQAVIKMMGVRLNATIDEFIVTMVDARDFIQKNLLRVEGGMVVLVVDYLKENVENRFQIQYRPKKSSFSAKVEGIVLPSYQTWIDQVPQLFLTLNTKSLITNQPNISILNSTLKLLVLDINSNLINMKFQNNQTLHGTTLSLLLTPNSQHFYHQIISFPIITRICSPYSKNQQSPYFTTICIIVTLYWITYFIGIFCCQKIYVIQTMFALQFVYLSYIQMISYCSPFSSFKILRYSFGWNKLFESMGLKEIPLTYYYSSLGFQSNFMSNINFMLIPFVAFPIISIIFFVAGKRSQGYRAKPRLLAIAQIMLLEIPVTTIIFNTPNIVSSFVINYQSFGIDGNMVSFIVSCVVASLILFVLILFLALKKSYFRQFNLEFCSNVKIFKLSLESSAKVKKLYPFLLLIEITLISCFLSMQSFFNTSLYISLGILILFLTIKLILSPFSRSIDNARLFIHQFLMIFLNCLQIGFKFMKQQPQVYQQTNKDTISLFPWSVLVTLVVMLVGNTIPYLIYKIVLWVRSKGLININLYNRTESKHIKPNYYRSIRKINKSTLFYPALEYSINYKKREMNKEGGKEIGKGLVEELMRADRINMESKYETRDQE